MANPSSHWQNTINPQLLGRLVLPLTQAGVMKRDMSQKIIDRSDRFLNRLPLFSQQMQRWGSLNTLSLETVPIVYAQNIASTAENSNRVDQLVAPQITSQITSRNLPNTLPSSASSSLSSEMTLQAKFAGSEGLTSANSQSLTSLNSPPLTTELNTPNISGYPVVTPKNNVETFSVNQENLPLLPLTENLATSEPLPITQVKLPNPDFLPSELPVVNRLNNLINGIDNSPSPSQRDLLQDKISQGKISQGKTAQGNVYLRDHSPNYVEPINSQINSQINAQIFTANNPIVTSAETLRETTVSAENPISPALESTQDHTLPIVKPKSTGLSNILTTSSNINIKNIKDEQNPLPIVNPSAPNNLRKSPQMYPFTTSSRNSDGRNSTTKTDAPQAISETGARELKVFTSPSPPTETVVSSMPNQPKNDPKIDVDAIANQVERKLMRRLVVESERRGHKR